MSRQAALANNPLAPDSLAKSIDLTSNLRSLFDRGGSGNIRKQSTIRLEWLRPNPNQPRRQFSPEEMQSLQASIQAHGVLEPILVRLVGQAYEIICGERRFRAAQALGLAEVPVVVRDATDDEAFLLSLQENIQRNDLTPIEEAQAYKSILDRGLASTQRALANLLGVSQTHISRKLALLELPQELQHQVTTGELNRNKSHPLMPRASNSDESHPLITGASPAEASAPPMSVVPRSRSRRLTERHIRSVRRLSNPTSQKLLFDQIAAKRLSVAQTEKLVDQVLANSDHLDDASLEQPVPKATTWAIGNAKLTDGPDGLHIHIQVMTRSEQVAELRKVLASLTTA